MKKRLLIIAFIFTLLYNADAFAGGAIKFADSFWYTNGNGHWTFFVKDIYGAMDYLRNIKVGINEENDFVYTTYYFDMYGHCHKTQDDEFPSIYINQYIGPIDYYRKEHDIDGMVVYQSNQSLPNIR